MTCNLGPFCHSKVYPGPGDGHYQGGGEEGIIHGIPRTVITPCDESLNPQQIKLGITSEQTKGIVNSNIIYIC